MISCGRPENLSKSVEDKKREENVRIGAEKPQRSVRSYLNSRKDFILKSLVFFVNHLGLSLFLFVCSTNMQYNTIKPKTFKPNLLDEPKDISSPEFLFSLFLLLLNRIYL